MTPARRDWVAQYRAAIDAGAASFAAKTQSQPEDSLLVAAIGLRETWLGRMPGYVVPAGADPADGTGDHGHGRGLFQIDDRGPYKHLIQPAPWPAEKQVEACCEVLADNRRALRQFVNSPRFLLAVVCGYNASIGEIVRLMTGGWDPNRATFGGDYGDDVLRVYAELTFPPKGNP